MRQYKRIIRRVKKLNKNMQFAIALFFLLVVTAVASVTQLVNNSNFDLRQQAADDAGGGGLYAPTNTPTPTKLANGQLCQTNSQCQSNYCADGFCQPITNQPTATPTVAKKPNYSTCSSNSECQSNICQASLCRPVPTATPIPGVPTSVPTPPSLGTCSTSVTCQSSLGCYCPSTCVKSFAATGSSCGGYKGTCQSNADCQTGYSCVIDSVSNTYACKNLGAGGAVPTATPIKKTVNQLCSTTSECQTGLTCTVVSGSIKVCKAIATLTPTPVEKKANGQSCTSNTQCLSNLCRTCQTGELCPDQSGKFCFAPSAVVTVTCLKENAFCGPGSNGSCCSGYYCDSSYACKKVASPTPTPIIEQAYSTATICSNYQNDQIGCISHGCQYVATTNYSGTCGANYGKSTNPICGVSSSGTCAGASLGSSCNNNTGLCARNPYADAGDTTCVCEVKNSVSRVEVSGGNTCPGGSVCICKTSGSFIESGQYCPRAVSGGQTCPAGSPSSGCWCNTAFGRTISAGEQCYDRPEDVAKFVAEGVGLTAGIVALPVLPQVGTAGYVYSSIYGGAALTAAAQSGVVQTLLQPLSSPVVQNVVGNSTVQLWGARIVGAGLGALDAYGFASSGAPTSQMLSPYLYSNADNISVAYGNINQRGLNNLGINPGIELLDDGFRTVGDDPVRLVIDWNSTNTRSVIDEGLNRMNNPIDTYEASLDPIRRAQSYMQEAFPEYPGIEAARDSLYNFNSRTGEYVGYLDDFCASGNGVCFEQSQVMAQMLREAGYDATPLDVFHGIEYTQGVTPANHSVVVVWDGIKDLIVDPRYNFIGTETQALNYYSDIYGGAYVLGYSR